MDVPRFPKAVAEVVPNETPSHERLGTARELQFSLNNLPGDVSPEGEGVPSPRGLGSDGNQPSQSRGATEQQKMAMKHLNNNNRIMVTMTIMTTTTTTTMI